MGYVLTIRRITQLWVGHDFCVKKTRAGTLQMDQRIFFSIRLEPRAVKIHHLVVETWAGSQKCTYGQSLIDLRTFSQVQKKYPVGCVVRGWSSRVFLCYVIAQGFEKISCPVSQDQQ